MKRICIFVGLKLAEVAAVVLVPYWIGAIFGYFAGGTWGEPVWFTKWCIGFLLSWFLGLLCWFLKRVLFPLLSDLVKWNWKLARRLSK